MDLIFSQYLATILSVSGLVMISLISPGPDFAIVVKNSLVYSRKTAILTAFGIALGVLVHVAYTTLGLGLLISKTPWLFFGLKCAGALYLLHIGFKGLCAKKAMASSPSTQHKHDISPLAAVRLGFLTNALNPKCMLFFMSLFSVVIAPNTPLIILAIYGVIIFVATLAWLGFVAFCLSGEKTRNKFSAISHWIERGTGIILMALGLLFFML